MLPDEPPGWMQPRWGAWNASRGSMGARAARRDAALDSSTSMGATVGHLVAAVRKLAAVNTAEENGRKLYRGVKGILQGSFWIPDALGVVCATDAAFMSTSLGEATPVHYMEANGRPNVLFELEAAAADDAGFHCGAEVAMLSQFADEREVLFPPLSLLRVRPRRPPPVLPPLPDVPSAQAVIERSQALLQVTPDEIMDEKQFTRVTVMPSFTG
jgi:hypothetical protein